MLNYAYWTGIMHENVDGIFQSGITILALTWRHEGIALIDEASSLWLFKYKGDVKLYENV